MDGQIGRTTNKRILGSELPHGGVPPKAAKLELSSEKKVKICAELTSKLTLSSPPIASPDTERAVSSTDSPLSGVSHSFDFRFVASDDEVRQLLVAEASDENRDVTLISDPDDLSQDNLVSRLSISGDGRHVLRSGKLFEGPKPLTLVMDIRKLTSGELPKFNDLLDPDNPCLYDKVSKKKRPLGEHVALLVLASPEQLSSVGQLEDAPGADFWRRINRPGNTWQFDPQNGNDQAMEINEAPPVLAEFPSAKSAMDDGHTVLIDCHLHSNWRQLLLGGPGVDEQGRIQHIPGRLESLRAGQRVILKGADWQDLAFEQAIRQMLAQKCYESNGEICQLPDDVQFYQMPVGKDELQALFQSLSRSLNKEGQKEGGKELDIEQAPRNPIIINQSNIREWLSPIAIAPEGHAVPNTCLLEQVRAGGEITVTSPLTEALWFRLLGSLQTIRENTGLEPRLQVAHSKQQPETLGLAENDERPVRDRAIFNSVTYQQPAQANYWINNNQKTSLVIQINEQTSLSQLFDNIHITSEQKARFGRRQTALQEALTSGRPVVLRGLESNPNLQRLLEPLVIGQPLLVNGQLQAYPQAHVTLLWPESAKTQSSVISSMVATAEPCFGVDIWVINGNKHDIPLTKLPEQALHQLYEAFKTVPGDLCNPLPELTEGLLNNLILAARRAQQVDQSPQLLPRHWRKAINSVITHGTRQNPSVRDFMKVACCELLPDAYEKPDEHQTASVDLDRLNDFINSAPQLDRACVQQNPWPLARAFDPATFKETRFRILELSYKNPFPSFWTSESLDKLCAMIVAHVPEQQRQAIAHLLEVDPAAAEQYQTLAIRPSRQMKRLEDALASGWQLPLSSGQTRSDAIQALANDCFHIARTVNSDVAGIKHIENRLSQSLEWQGTADQSLSALAHDLYHGLVDQKDRESRRLSRLHDRLADSPVLFLQGETGTGKSYFSARMAKASGQASVISLGPSDSEQTLMKRWQWQEHANGNRAMKQQNRMLMEWAKTTHDKDGEYVTLILDEANLAKTGLLASLNGLWEPEPCIYVNGHPVKVSSKHRVILTGNPDHYAGRQLDPALKEKLPRAYYPRLDRAFLRDRVVEPALIKHLQRHLPEPQINDIAHIATESVMALWQYYQELLPEHEFTPRDLTDICSWMGWYLDCALPINDSVNYKQINGLIQQSFRDVLGSEISETDQDALTALEIWFATRYHSDNTLSNKVHHQTTLLPIQQAFKKFTEQTRPDFDISGSAVHELVQRLGQDLSRCQQAYQLNRQHDGRQATLIEGPAGRGKDATLNLIIESVKRQAEHRGESMPEVFPLNACDCSWDKVCEKIQTAKVHGGIVVISEMNLIDSQHLEGELNDILAGDAHPGFHLFATINPPEYSGRKPLSPALKGRFRHLPIRQYSPAELQTIAEKVLPKTLQGKIIAEHLTKQHCRLRTELQRKKLPLQPTSLDLQNVAIAVIQGGDFTEDGLNQCINQHYRLYLMASGISLEALPESSALVTSNAELDSELCKWFNKTVSDIDRPWLIRLGDLNSIDEKRHEICIKSDLSGEKTRTEIIKRVAQASWQASGLSVKPGESDDILTQALYRHWQQRWFDHKFGQTGVDVNSVFPLTEEEKQTLKLSANQPYLREADQRIEAWNTNAVQCWPVFWHQMSDLLSHLVDDYIDEAPVIGSDNDSEQYLPQVHEKQAPALDQNTNHEPQPDNEALTIGTDEAPEKYNPEAHAEKAPALDRITNYENRSKPKRNEYIIFNSQRHLPRFYRFRAEDVYVSDKGEISRITINDLHMQGAEVLIPDRLPGQDQEVTLASDQTLATFDWTSDDDQCELPGLTPNDYIVALRLEPDMKFTLIRDRYTGLHTLFIPEAKPNQSIEIAYVVEPRIAVRKTPARGAGPARPTRFDARCSEGMKNVLKNLFDINPQQPAEVKVLWQGIQDATNTRQRIEAIAHYCKQFSGDAEPGRYENFFQFLVTRRQGSCRHRVPVFIALCRYFGIPCRLISSRIHAFAEYSPDGGETWARVDFSGSSVEKTIIKSNFQPIREVSGSGAGSKKLKDLLKGADLAQQQALAEAYGISLEELKRAIETGGALPITDPSTFTIVKKLWEKKDLPEFSMGVSILLETETLGYFEKELVGDVYDPGRRKYKLMSEAVKKILSNSDGEQITEQLKLLHSKMIVQAGASPHQWLSSIIEILKDSDLNKPSIIRLADAALESGWLNPLPTDERRIVNAFEHHELLLRLERIDELKVKAAQCLKNWYKELLSKEKNSQQWQSAYEEFQNKKGNVLFVTHCHDGFSPFLKANITDPSLQTAWTDEPEGVPNIERMLVRQPAFEQLTSDKANHRPVIILGQPSWSGSTVLYEKIEALLQIKAESSPNLKQLLEKIKLHPLRVSPRDMKLLNDLKGKCLQAIQHAFSHYLYGVTHSKGGCLTYCWGDASVLPYGHQDVFDKPDSFLLKMLHHFHIKHFKGSHLSFASGEAPAPLDDGRNNYGAHEPSSPEELYAMMSVINSSSELQISVMDAHLRQALNANNALVLKSDELTKIAQEFLNSVNLNSLCDSLGTWP